MKDEQEQEEHEDTRVDGPAHFEGQRATAASNEAVRTDVTARTVRIISAIYDLKEDVLHADGIQPQFDAGMLEGALAVLEANLDTDDPLFIAERQRQMDARLRWVLGSLPAPDAVARGSGDGQSGPRATDALSCPSCLVLSQQLETLREERDNLLRRLDPRVCDCADTGKSDCPKCGDPRNRPVNTPLIGIDTPWPL